MNYGTIAGIVLLAIIIFIIVVKFKSSSDKDKAKKFIENLADNLVQIMISTIGRYSPEDFEILEDFENTILSSIYEETWDYVSEIAEEDVGLDILTKSVFKYIKKDAVVDFVNELIMNRNITKDIEDIYGSYAISNSNIEEEDKKLEEEYSDDSMYLESLGDDITIEDVEGPVEEPVHSKEELESIIPPRDEDEEFNIEDDSMEIIVDKKEIVSIKAKNGQILYYELDKNGKKKRVSKDYAMQHLSK
jgi:hypothetical protein